MPPSPSPWFQNRQPQPHESASWVEYLRWSRVTPSDGTEKSGTIMELFQKFEQGDYSHHLERLCQRTKDLAGDDKNWFIAQCPWRIRVGGVRGPEEMLLPAFNHIGIPYIPSSTLKGIARATAKREINERELNKIFGSIDGDATQMGQVVFLDAYPNSKGDDLGGLQLDMANQIWKWEGDTAPTYKTNPNLFISLEEPKFVIGLRQGTSSDEAFQRVMGWLKKGLATGIGAQVNSGYGVLETEEIKLPRILPPIKFKLKGQLIHGHQEFVRWERTNDNRGWKPPGKAVEEVRSTAFRSMLRYWFRALALGVLPQSNVHSLEHEIFGGIDPQQQKTGNFRLVVSGSITQSLNRQSPGIMEGNLKFYVCPQANRQIPEDNLKTFLQTLTWLMVHLGGVGQGARRPCHQRNNNPYWRGATLTITNNHDYWQDPSSLTKFQALFAKRMKKFYSILQKLSDLRCNWKNPNSVQRNPDRLRWAEAIDRQCEIVCVSGQDRNHKPFALAELHELAYGNRGYNPALCGNSNDKPSPIWIAALEHYQVVTVLGANERTRQQYLQKLDDKAEDLGQLWPLH